MKGDITTINTRHDIGLVAAVRLVAIFWAGLLPVVIPATLLIKGEISAQNQVQDTMIRHEYVSKIEFEARMKILDERAEINQVILKEIREEQKYQRELLEKLQQTKRRE